MLIRTITLAAAVVSSIVASPGIAQDDVEPEFDITMHDYWGSVSYADYPGQAGGLAFTWVDAEDGELGEHPTQDTSPGVLRIHYREDAEGCSVDIEMAMREYFPRFEFIELVVGGETFELTTDTDVIEGTVGDDTIEGVSSSLTSEKIEDLAHGTH